MQRARGLQQVRGVFVAYWPCGKCINGFSMDYGDVDHSSESAGPMLADALRAGRKVEYVTEGRELAMRQCICPPPTTANTDRGDQ